MNVYQLADPAALRVRAHPWVDAEGDASYRYYDLRRHPRHIRTSLEDLVAWRELSGVETFFQLIEWLNGPDSALESNDCAFSGPGPNTGDHSPLRLGVSGRLMVLFRQLERNTDPDEVDALTQQVGYALTLADPELDAAAIGVSVVEVQFTELPDNARAGHQLMVSFWAWGDDEAEVDRNLVRTLDNLWTALRSATGTGSPA